MHLFVKNILPERVEHGFEGLRPSRHDGVLDDTPVPPIPGLKQLPVLQLSVSQENGVGNMACRCVAVCGVCGYCQHGSVGEASHRDARKAPP